MSAEIDAGNAATGRFDTLHAEAKEALAYAANTLRAVTERYREAFHEDLAGWHGDRDALRTSALGERQAELARLELAVRGLERTWLFLERGGVSLLGDPTAPDLASDLQMRIVEAREAERTRLAQEIHDGPAQALANAIFGVELVEKVVERDRAAARAELRSLRERLSRDLGEVRAFISQLRPLILDEVGLDGAIHDAAATLVGLTGVALETDLHAPASELGDTEQVVVLRVLQEALHNVRKHAGAPHVWVATRLDEGRWVLEVRDDGRGFDPDAAVAHERRTFGLQFMRERAELVRGSFEIRSRPGSGTTIVLGIPVAQRGDSA